ncbi:uncharacterized protein YlbG (UPF0298 family) [Caldalkalibacillus uzonensis]|uniref:UPF0298 protein J2S00_001977 n=1 Tax=Caldalkalibacillus uzonensis TaxID=353224 RepID=A0ABU0CRZ0_9BACI|nr:DUF2129 domain-containing protein [Caldalkalibacillus uzonensis]MDQ0339191.1 uncharacterized protein YlbG (UPF0298 family) [Caldalkalibacillus uzonensis]
MFVRKRGLAVWLNQVKMARHLRKFGNVHYVSRRMRYVILYVDENKVQDMIAKLNRLNYVKRVEPSHRHELRLEFQSKADKAEEYDYQSRI